jgi:lysyl-tRNA synthetase class 2
MITRNAHTPLAKRLRREPTQAESLLWQHLRNRQLQGWKFRRQFPIDKYIVDFCCAEARLVVELDGGQHVEQREHDAARTEVLSAAGYLVLRFWNNDVLANIGGVLETIVLTLEPAFEAPHPNPLPGGERESR